MYMCTHLFTKLTQNWVHFVTCVHVSMFLTFCWLLCKWFIFVCLSTNAAHTCTYMYTCTYTHAHTCTCTHTHMRTHAHTYTYMYTCTYMFTCTYTHAHTLIHTHMHTHTCTHTFFYMHTQGSVVDINEVVIRHIPYDIQFQGPVYDGPVQVIGPGYAPFKPYLRPRLFYLRVSFSYKHYSPKLCATCKGIVV